MAKKEEIIEGAEMEQDSADHGELRVYELGFHIDSELPETAMKKVWENIHATIEKAGTIVAEGAPIKVPLAYTISRQEHAGRRDFNSSFFAWIAYETDGKGHVAITEAAKADSSIFRFLDVRTNKEAAQQAEQLQEIMLKAEQDLFAQNDETDAPALDEELDAALKEVTV